MDILRAKKEWILKEWRARVCKIIPASRDQSSLALNDSLPDFIDNLADQLFPQTPIEQKISEAKESLIGKVHGQHRANNSYSIDQMIDEYFVLKDVILTVLQKEKALTMEIRETIDLSFQKALQVSAAQFSKSLLESQEEFVMSLAHDLRSPLMAIKMQASIIDKKAAYDPVMTNKIKASADKINLMIENLLDVIKAERSPNPEFDYQEFDFSEVLNSAVEENRESIPNEIIVVAEETHVCWDRQAFVRIIDNLISNAAKYGFEESPITISLRSDGTNAFFSVHNLGDPIPADEQLSLFQKFRRSNKDTRTAGWGIGLSYVKSVIEKHKGIVLVNSDEKGTTFKFELPLNIRKVGHDGLKAAKFNEPNDHINPL